MSHKLTEDPWDEEESAAASSFMEDAFRMLHEYLDSSDLQIWRGKQRFLPDTHLEDTIIVSQSATDWDENRPRKGYLLWMQQKGMNVTFETRIGLERLCSFTPFSGGHSPIKKVANLSKKMAHLNLSVTGSMLMELLQERVRDLCYGTSIHSEVCESGRQTLYRCDVHNGLTNEDWFCVAFLLNEAGQVGIWTRDDFDRVTMFHEVNFKHDLTVRESVGWIDDVLLSDTVLTELTR